MKTTRISGSSTQLTFYGSSNCYLVRESDGFTVVDTSVGGCARQIAQAAQEGGGTIRRVLLTHAHGDHVGSLDALHTLLGRIDVAIGEREAPLLHKDLSLRPGEPQKKPGGSFPGTKTRPTHTLCDGELFGSLRCFDTPGHTPGHMSFLDERDGTLYTGDAMQSIGGLSVVTDTPWWFPLPKIATWDRGLALDSARKLARLEVTGVANGHGSFVAEGSAAIQQAVRRADAHA